MRTGTDRRTLDGVRLVGGTADLVDVDLADGRVVAVRPSTGGRYDGRWVMPGLWDHHVHWEQWSLLRTRLDLRASVSARDAARVVGTRLRDAPPPTSGPLLGYGYHAALWPDVPTLELLDQAAAHTPVVLYSNDLHSGWLNTAAWRMLGRAEGPALVVEADFVLLCEQMRPYEAAARSRATRDAARDASARGVVGIVDLEGADSLTTWTGRVGDGVDGLRVECGVYPAELDLAIARGLRTGEAVDGTRGLVTQGPLKVIVDGSLGSRTAYCDAPYPGLDASAHPHGMLLTTPAELETIVRRGCRHGLLPAVHAIGDHANALALDMFQALGCPGRIEHAQQLRVGDAERFAALGVAASVQPAHCPDDRDIADRCWPGSTDLAFPYRTLHEAGVRMLFGSDAPVAPLDPWLAIATAVRRSTDDREPWHPAPPPTWSCSTTIRWPCRPPSWRRCARTPRWSPAAGRTDRPIERHPAVERGLRRPGHGRPC